MIEKLNLDQIEAKLIAAGCDEKSFEEKMQWQGMIHEGISLQMLIALMSDLGVTHYRVLPGTIALYRESFVETED